MKCRKCHEKAIIKLPRHNTAFCKECFLTYFYDQVRKALREEGMIGPEDRVCVAISGGKDSLTLWDALLTLGYRATGLHIDQGIGEYSTLSREKTEKFAQSRRADLITYDVTAEYGAGIPEIARQTGRVSCSACGLIKRYNFNRIAREKGFTILATGHNLDDEAARLLGNILHWQEDYLAKQAPLLPASHPTLVKKIKPLYRLAEREVTAYAVITGIDYVVEECPHSKGSKLLIYKEVLNILETDAPGTKHNFYLSFLRRQNRSRRTPSLIEQDRAVVHSCVRCGEPTTEEVCGHCRLVEKLTILR